MSDHLIGVVTILFLFSMVTIMSNINSVDYVYSTLLGHVLSNGVVRDNRTGTPSISIFPAVVKYDLSDNMIPLLQTKRVAVNAMIHELLWFISGSTSVKYLLDNNVRIWNPWVKVGTEVYKREEGERVLVDGDLGPVYGKQWRFWEDTRLVSHIEFYGNLGKYLDQGYVVVDKTTHGMLVITRKIDQLSNIVQQLKNDPTSRRIILSAWNVGDLDHMALPPCHMTLQLYVRDLNGGTPPIVDAVLYMRSNDLPIGCPFNIAQYGLLVQILAHMVGYKAGHLTHVIGDAHIYTDQSAGVYEQLSREIPAGAPKVEFARMFDSVDDIRFDDIKIVGYNPQPGIKFPAPAV